MTQPQHNDEQPTAGVSRRAFVIGGAGLAASEAATPFSWSDVSSAISRDNETKNTVLNLDRVIELTSKLSEEGKGQSHQLLTPVDKTSLKRRLSNGYTVVSFQFAQCTDVCPPTQMNLSDLQEAIKKIPNGPKLNHLVIDASAQDPDGLKKRLIDVFKLDKDRVFVFSPPFNNQKPAENMQHSMGLKTSDILKKDKDIIKELGHSSRVHIFAPDGTCITAGAPINANALRTKDEKGAAELMLDAIQKDMKKNKGTSRS